MCESDLGREPSRAQGQTPNSRASSLLQDLIEAPDRRGGHCTRTCRCREARGKDCSLQSFCISSIPGGQMCESGLGRESSRAQCRTPNSRASSLLQDLIEAPDRRGGYCTRTCRCREAHGCARAAIPGGQMCESGHGSEYFATPGENLMASSSRYRLENSETN